MAFEESYDCRASAETSIGWDSKARRYSAEASTSLKRPAIVKLSDLNAPIPLLTGQSVTPLRKVSETSGAMWLIEETAAGTIIGWTFIEKAGPFSPPDATLVSTKTYDLFGPATFTALYRCTPNRPSR
jgi:hypothetical protein